jgi:hypothetical protein
METIKIWPPHVFKYKHTKWSLWCITASLNYKNTMINRITMEKVAGLRSKCHLKQNLIPSWPWSFRHTSCVSDAKQNTQTKFFVGHLDRHTWQFTFNKSGYIFPYVDSVYYTHFSREWESRKVSNNGHFGHLIPWHNVYDRSRDTVTLR